MNVNKGVRISSAKNLVFKFKKNPLPCFVILAYLRLNLEVFKLLNLENFWWPS